MFPFRLKRQAENVFPSDAESTVVCKKTHVKTRFNLIVSGKIQ